MARPEDRTSDEMVCPHIQAAWQGKLIRLGQGWGCKEGDFRHGHAVRNVYIEVDRKKHTCALTSGTFMCCNVVLMVWNKPHRVWKPSTSISEAPLAAVESNINPHMCYTMYINRDTYTNHMSAQETSDGALNGALGEQVTHSSRVETYSGYRVSALQRRKRSPAHLRTTRYQLFPLYPLPWSTPTISIWLNGS